MAFSINAPAAPAANDQAAFLSAAEAASPSSPSIDGVVSAGVGVVEGALTFSYFLLLSETS